MYRKNLCKSIVLKCAIFAAVAAMALSGCKKKVNNEASDGVADTIGEISALNDIDAFPGGDDVVDDNKESASGVGDKTEGKESDKSSNQSVDKPVDSNSESGTQGGTESSQKTEATGNVDIDSASVIRSTVADLSAIIPQMKHSDSLSGGQFIDITISTEYVEKDVAGLLYDTILDLVEYDLYLENQGNPNISQTVVLDYTYRLKYRGISQDKKDHVFEFQFMLNEQTYQDVNFDSNAVISQVTERILNSSHFEMSLLSGGDYKTTRMIEGIQTYESTAEAVENLTRYVENEIRGLLYGVEQYTSFRLEFYSKGTTSYTFILYLG